jgi:hypothetical protein
MYEPPVNLDLHANLACVRNNESAIFQLILNNIIWIYTHERIVFFPYPFP